MLNSKLNGKAVSVIVSFNDGTTSAFVSLTADFTRFI